jgi:hypothetical protein
MAKDDWIILGIVAAVYFFYSKGAAAAGNSQTTASGANPGVACQDTTTGAISFIPMGPCPPTANQVVIS